MDETQLKIMNATMTLITEKGYSNTTTKNIAKLAGVNESTIFRRFQNKKEIVLEAMKLPKWNPNLSEDDFVYTGNLKEDLYSFSMIYMKKVTPEMVKVSLGLRSIELEGVAMEGILNVPMTFKNVLMKYFNENMDKIKPCDIESLSLQFLAMNFGFVFFKASFGESLSEITKEEYIQNSIQIFLSGIQK